MENNVVLKFNHVTKTYDENKVTALKDANFELHKGEFVSIIGPSGSGKSTLLRCINRLISITSGNIQFLDFDVERADKNQLKQLRKEVGMIFQNYNLVYRLNIMENVLHGRLGYYPTWKSCLGIYDEKDIEKAQGLLDMLGLGDRVYDQCAKLSGGQKQRVGIARALIQDPKLLLADEPIASLDPQSSKVIMEYLKKVCTEFNIPVLVNLHQVDVALNYSDRIIGMHKGEIVFNGKPSELTDEMIERIYGVPVSDLISNVEVQA